MTNPALETKPVIVRCALCRTVIAENDGLGILILVRHRLVSDGYVDVAELRLHIDNALATDRAFIRSLQIFVIAFLVYAMTTSHEDNGLWRGKHIITANRAV